ncbi:MAG: LamG domain-containing protein [Verrucomicrobiota bacterium JB024]|nr:LamG domain-containing protein [Verrucomicrobiota bacterium JB024]
MKNIHYLTSIACVLIGFSAIPAHADQTFYLPFDLDGSPSLTNEGTLGGTAIAEDGPGPGDYTPIPSSLTAPRIGSTYSEYFRGDTSGGPSSVSAGVVILPNSTNQFNLDSSSSKMTISTWVKWDGALKAGQLAGIANKMSGSTGWALTLTDTGQIRFAYGTSVRKTVSTIATGSWVHVAASWDTGSSSALSVYVDGVLQTLDIAATGTSTLPTNTESIRLGSTTYSGYNSLNGNLDDFAMWNSVLSAAQVRAIGTIPEAIDGYNAGYVNELFQVADGSIESATISGSVWTQASGFDVTGHELGDTWETESAYYVWLSGDSANAMGVTAAIPEASQATLLIGVLGLLYMLVRRRSHKNREG